MAGLGLMEDEMDSSPQWKIDSLRWRGRVLTGAQAHWCPEWDWLPVDETTPEWPCGCKCAFTPEVKMEVLEPPAPSGSDGPPDYER